MKKLNGSEKQIAWAEQIREKITARLEQLIESTSKESKLQQYKNSLEEVQEIENAKDFIDLKDFNFLQEGNYAVVKNLKTGQYKASGWVKELGNLRGLAEQGLVELVSRHLTLSAANKKAEILNQ